LTEEGGYLLDVAQMRRNAVGRAHVNPIPFGLAMKKDNPT
jgi:hypothetical protein